MKQILIIGSTQQQGSKNDPEAVCKALDAGAVHAMYIAWEDLVLRVQAGNVSITAHGQELTDHNPDMVMLLGWYKQSLYRELALCVGLYLQHANIHFVNTEAVMQRPRTKLACMVQLALNDIPVPVTHYAVNGESLRDQELPVIVKAFAASRGASNHLVSEVVDLERLLSESPNKMLVQPFLPNDHDLRVIMFAGKPSMVLKRSRLSDATSHLNNVSQGARADWLALTDVDSHILTMSEKICRIMGREMAGIDLIPDVSSPCGYSCLEVNPIPQLTSGHDADKKLSTLAETLKNL